MKNNNVLTINDNIKVGLKEGFNNFSLNVDYFVLGNHKYYLSGSNTQKGINELVSNTYQLHLHQLIETNLNQLVTDKDLGLFVSEFKRIVDKYEININQEYDVIGNEIYVNYKDKLYFDINIDKLFDGKLSIKLNNKSSTYDLNDLTIDNPDNLVDGEFRVILRILKVLNSMKSHNNETIEEYIKLLKFIKNKKTIKINKQTYKLSSIYNLLKELKEKQINLIRYARTGFSLNNLTQIVNYYNSVKNDIYARL